MSEPNLSERAATLVELLFEAPGDYYDNSLIRDRAYWNRFD